MSSGGAPPDAADLLTTWTWAPAADALIVVAVIAYLAATGMYRRSRRVWWPTGRTLCWLIGAVFAAACVNSALAVFSRNLLWVHMIVHLLLITVVPALAVWAQPIRLVHGAVGPQRFVSPLRKSRIVRWSTTPLLTVPLYSVVLVGTHLTGFQQLVPHRMWLHNFELGLYLLSGYLLLLPIVGGELSAVALAPLLRIVVLILCMGPDTLVGVVLMLTGVPSAPAYSEGRQWGPTAMADQKLAGGIMWWGGDGLMMILVLVVAAQWIRASSDRGSDLGPWLDRVRQQTLLGTDTDVDVDQDEAALAAYNARLAALHGVAPRAPGIRRHSD